MSTGNIMLELIDTAAPLVGYFVIYGALAVGGIYIIKWLSH